MDFTINGRRVRESTGTEDQRAAKAKAKARWDEVWGEEMLGVAPRTTMTFGAAADRYWTEVGQHLASGANSVRHHLKLLRRVVGERQPMASLNADRVAQVTAKLVEGRAPSTVNVYLGTLHRVCRRAADTWGVAVGRWQPSAHTLPERGGREAYLTRDQARELLAAACAHLRPIIALAASTGLRRDNAVRLTWEAVSIEDKRATVRAKGDRRHTVELSDQIIDLLRIIEPDPGKRSGPIFRYGNSNIACGCLACANHAMAGRPVTNIRRPFAAAVREAGLAEQFGAEGERIVFHSLRHTFASWLLDATGDLRLVQDALGHRHIKTTTRYTHVNRDRARAGVVTASAGLWEKHKADDNEPLTH